MFEYILRASHFIETEQEIIKERLEHPEWHCNVVSKQTELPKFYWSSKFNKRCFLELITALDCAGAIVDSTNKPIDFTILAQSVGKLFSIEVPAPDKERIRLLGRTRKLTHFIDILKVRILENANKTSNENND